MNLWQQFRAVVRDLPRFYADRFDHWAIRAHFPVNWQGREPGEDLGPCAWCGRSWPCRPWSEAMDRLAGRLAA